MATALGAKKSASSGKGLKLCSFVTDVVTVNNADTYTANIYAGVTSNGSGEVVVNGCVCNYSATGRAGKSNASWRYANAKPYADYASGNNKNFNSITYSWTKGHSTQTITVTMSAYGGGGNSWGSKSSPSVATRTFVIPARAAYTVSYNANGGTGAPGAQTKWYNETLTLSTTTPTRTGYTCRKWYTSTSGGTAITQYTGNASTTLYAQWDPIQYTVAYDANGGTNAPESITATYDQDVILIGEPPVRNGYSFLGWSESNNATAATWAAGATVTKPNWLFTSGTKTLYAVWSPNLYTYTYQAPEGDSSIVGEPFTQSQYHDISVLLARQGFTKNYYYLNKWKYQTGEEGQTIEHIVDLNSECTANQNLTINPVFAPNTVTMTYYSEGVQCSGAAEQIIAYTGEPNNIIRIQNPNNFNPPPGKTGYHFKTGNEWLINNTSVGQGTEKPWTNYGQTNVVNTVVRADLQWAPNTYTIMFNGGGSSYVSNLPQNQTATYDKSFTISSKIPKRYGYTFVEWQDSQDSEKVYHPGETIRQNLTTLSGGVITLVAQWKLIVNRITIVDFEFDRATNGDIDSSGPQMIGNIYYYPGHYWNENNSQEVSFDFEDLTTLHLGTTAIDERSMIDSNQSEAQSYFKEILRQNVETQYIHCQTGEICSSGTNYYELIDDTYQQVANLQPRDDVSAYYKIRYLKLIRFQAYYNTGTTASPQWNPSNVTEARSYIINFSQIYDNPSLQSIEQQNYEIITSGGLTIPPVSFIIDVNSAGTKVTFGSASDDEINNKGVYIGMKNSLYMILDDNVNENPLNSAEVDGSIITLLTKLHWNNVFIQ